MMYYDFLLGAAIHASDLLPTFYIPMFDIKAFLKNYICVKVGDKLLELYAAVMNELAPLYQSYLSDLAVYGDPNHHPKPCPDNQGKSCSWTPAQPDTSTGRLESVFRVQQAPF